MRKDSLESRLGHELGERYIFLVLYHIRELLSLFVAVADLGDEGVLQELVYRPALVHCLLQALLHEVAVGGGELGLVEAMGVFRGDEIHGLEGGHPEEWRFSLCELDCYHSD